MKHFTTKTYTLKREILRFAEKIYREEERPERKFGAEMAYEILASGSCLLTDMPDLDMALSIGNASVLTVTVEKVEKSWVESLIYWGEKYKVSYTLNDYYDFDEWAGTNRSTFSTEVWVCENEKEKSVKGCVLKNPSFSLHPLHRETLCSMIIKNILSGGLHDVG